MYMPWMTGLAIFATSYYTMHRMLCYHGRAVEVQLRVAKLLS